jgi:hypothetical protein
MLQMAQSVGRLVLAGRELTKLAGFTARLDEFGEVLRDLQEDKTSKRQLVRSGSRRSIVSLSGSGTNLCVCVRVCVRVCVCVRVSV